MKNTLPLGRAGKMATAPRAYTHPAPTPAQLLELAAAHPVTVPSWALASRWRGWRP